MITLERQLEAVIREVVKESNIELDKVLQDEIVKNILDKRLQSMSRVEAYKIEGFKVKNRKVLDISKVEPNGVWVYSEPTVEEWVFERYDTIEQAIKAAIMYIGDVKIICDGEVINWDVIDNCKAVYEDIYCSDRFVEVNIA